ncbi:hypothetical protein QYF36_009171 [Acer negundo]|nr:hypothetical protein QYF36_009171 [Acer negundo]
MCIAGIRIELRPGLIAGGPTTFDELSQRATGLADWEISYVRCASCAVFVYAWGRVGCSTTSLSLTSLRCVRYQDSIFPLFSLSSCEPGFEISGSKGPGRGLSKHLEKKEALSGNSML